MWRDFDMHAKNALKWTCDVLSVWKFISESAEQEITIPFAFKIPYNKRRDTTIYFDKQMSNNAVMLWNERPRIDQQRTNPTKR